jgi:putative DNA primase/helicase
MLPLFASRRSRVLHDADKPGQDGALGWTDPRSQQQRTGWAAAIASTADECRNVVLPYDVAPDHGKDLRDWLNEQPRSYVDLQGLAAAATVTPAAELPPTATKPLEAPDNYHRLARINLERYGRNTPNGTLRYWRNEWYKYDGTCYRKIDVDELKAKVGQAVKEEFDRINAEEISAWEGDKEPPNVRNVGHALISNVLFATSQMCILSGTVELNTWIDGPHRGNPHRYVALQNGILDIDALLAGEPDYFKPHSPHWFSVTCLPFAFDDGADSPRFNQFLNRNLEADAERINLLMEWAGYLLLPNTDYQKFMFFEGEGSNGKSVFLAAMEAMIGENNCSHVSLEAFSKDFVLTQTLGKLVNIASECSEMDSVAEGMLKAVASGDRMTFNRKGIPPIEATPTARLMLSANVRPRFADKSSGLWRRMILMPWRVVIQDDEKVIGMDKVEWWERSGELPGIFNWAIAGLAQLNEQGKFTRSEVCEAALASYRSEMNPTKVFLEEHYIADENKTSRVATTYLYDIYHAWCMTRSYKPCSDGTLGREIARVFATVEKKRHWEKNSEGKSIRIGYYHGIRPLKDTDDQEELSRQRATAGPQQLHLASEF